MVWKRGLGGRARTATAALVVFAVAWASGRVQATVPGPLPTPAAERPSWLPERSANTKLRSSEDSGRIVTRGFTYTREFSAEMEELVAAAARSAHAIPAGSLENINHSTEEGESTYIEQVYMPLIRHCTACRVSPATCPHQTSHLRIS